jgi:hypothetical protein
VGREAADQWEALGHQSIDLAVDGFLGALRSQRAIDQRLGYSHPDQLEPKPSWSSAAGGTGLDVVPSEPVVIQVAGFGRPVEGHGDRFGQVPFELEPASQVGPSERPPRDQANRGAKSAFVIGRALEPSHLVRPENQADPKRLGSDDLRRYGHHRPTFDEQADGSFSTRIGLEPSDGTTRRLHLPHPRWP